MHSSVREAKLHALLLNHDDVCEHVGKLTKTYETFLAEDVRETCLAHMVDTAQPTQRLEFTFDEACLCDAILPDAVLHLLAQFLNRKHRATTTYSANGSPDIPISPTAKFINKFSL